MNNTSNTTAYPVDGGSGFSPSMVAVLVVVQVLIIIAAVFGNLLVCIAICVSENLRNNAANYFIFSLAVSDLLTAIFSMPFDVEQMIREWKWSHGAVMCSVWTTAYLIMVPTSILSLLAVSYDRYKAICDPLNKFRETRFMTRKRAALIVCALWLYSLVFALLPTIGWKLYSEVVSGDNCHFNTTVEFSLLNSTLNFYVPLFVMCVIYVRIYKIASAVNNMLDKKTNVPNGYPSNNSRSSGAAMATPSNSSCDGKRKLIGRDEDVSRDHKTIKRERKKMKRNIKTAKSILLIVCTFFFCWIPYTTVSVVGILCMRCYDYIPPEVYSILLVMGYLNSALNPPLYSFHNPKFREVFRRLLGMKTKFESPKGASTNSHSSTNTAPKKVSFSSQALRSTSRHGHGVV